MKNPWAKAKENKTLNFVVNTRIMSKERKWQTLRAVDYSTPEKLTAWLECSEAIIAENFNAITDLLTKKSTCLNQAKQLQLDLATAEIDKQEVINNQITHFTNKAEEEEKDIAKHLDENDFLHTELEKIQNQVFLIERKTLAESSNNQTELAIITQLETIINEKTQLITNSIEKIEKQTSSQEAIRRESVLVKRRSTLTVLKNLEETSEEPAIVNSIPLIDSPLDQIAIELRGHLAIVEENWNNHLTKVKKNDLAYGGQEKIMEELTPFFEQILAENISSSDIRLLAIDLLTNWSTSKWRDGLTGDLLWLDYYIKEWDNQDSNVNNEMEDLKLEVEELNELVVKKEQEAESNLQAWKDANVQFKAKLVETITKKDEQYQEFISPTDRKKIKKAGIGVGLKTKEQLKAAVAKVEAELTEKITEVETTLATWTETFPEEAPEEVKKEQVRLTEAKIKLDIELGTSRKNLIAANSERDEWKTKGKRAENNNRRNEVDNAKLTQKNQDFFGLYNEAAMEIADLKDKLSEYERKISELEANLHESEEEVNNVSDNNSSAEDDDSTELKSNPSSAKEVENDNSDNESLLNEEIKSLTSVPRSSSPINSEHSDNEQTSPTSQQSYHSDNEQEEQEVNSEHSSRVHTPIEEEVSENDEEKEFNENELNEDELSEESKELLKQINEHKANLAKYLVKEKTVTDTQFLKQIEEIKADLNKWINEKKQKLCDLIEKEQNELNAQIETPTN